MAKLSFPELFAIELEGWRYGIEDNNKGLSKSDLFKVIREMQMVFEISIRNHHAFDLVKLAKDLSKASGDIAAPKEIAFYILNLLPEQPADEEQAKVISKLHSQVEMTYTEESQNSKNEFLGSFKKKLFA